MLSINTHGTVSPRNYSFYQRRPGDVCFVLIHTDKMLLILIDLYHERLFNVSKHNCLLDRMPVVHPRVTRTLLFRLGLSNV